MAHILILGGGAAGLAAALAAAQTDPTARVTVLERSPRPGKKLLATGNGRCNLDNEGITPESYSSADRAALDALLRTVNAADPLGWFRALGLYTRTDETGRVYPYSNQAADVLALLEHHLARCGVEVRTGCTVQTLSQNRGGYVVLFSNADGADESLRADAVVCAMGGSAGPQFGTDGFGPRFAAQCGGALAPLYPCLTALQCAKPDKRLAGIRAKAHAALYNGSTLLADYRGEVQFTDYGLSGICIMDLTRHLTPAVKSPAVELDLFPDIAEDALSALFAARVPLLPGDTAADFWLGLLNAKLGRALWQAAGLPDADVHRLSAAQWQKLAHIAKHWRFEGLTPCGWKQAQVTGGGLALTELAAPAFTLWAKRWTAWAAAAASTCTGPLAAALPPGAVRQNRAGLYRPRSLPAKRNIDKKSRAVPRCVERPGRVLSGLTGRAVPLPRRPLRLLPVSGTPQRPTTGARYPAPSPGGPDSFS